MDKVHTNGHDKRGQIAAQAADTGSSAHPFLRIAMRNTHKKRISTYASNTFSGARRLSSIVLLDSFGSS
ncbi:MAG TPA: hypothetical protein VK694_04685 [Verrucomicrobiae bacterium]|nr:hypothetical protein [Verrucomicrobiae bacterium]